MTPARWLLLFSVAGIPDSGSASRGPGREFTKAGILCTESVDATVPLTGQAVLTLTAEGTAPLAVDPVTFANPPDWRVRADSPSIADRPKARQQWRQQFRLVPDRAGDLTVQPPRILVRAGGRATPVEVEWRPLTVHVTTASGRADVDNALGVTGPETAPETAVPVWTDERFWAAVIVVAAVTGALLAGRRHRPGPMREPPPADWAAAELDRLDRCEPDADRLSTVLRGFLSRRFPITTVGTTAELVSLITDNAEAWRSVLERCDVARFSKVGIKPSEWSGILFEARRLITETLPVAEPAGSTGGGPARENA